MSLDPMDLEKTLTTLKTLDPMDPMDPMVLSLSFHISTFDKNYRCLEKLIKVVYEHHPPPPPPHKLILAYFNKLHGKTYQ